MSRRLDAFRRPSPFPVVDRIGGPYTVFGEVEYFDERGVFYTFECVDLATYEKALNVGAEWAAAEPKRPLDVRGTRFNPPKAAGFVREAACA